MAESISRLILSIVAHDLTAPAMASASAALIRQSVAGHDAAVRQSAEHQMLAVHEAMAPLAAVREG